MLVEGEGAEVFPIAESDAYHKSPVPVAINGAAGFPRQRMSGVVTTGGKGRAVIVTVMAALILSPQLPVF